MANSSNENVGQNSFYGSSEPTPQVEMMLLLRQELENVSPSDRPLVLLNAIGFLARWVELFHGTLIEVHDAGIENLYLPAGMPPILRSEELENVPHGTEGVDDVLSDADRVSGIFSCAEYIARGLMNFEGEDEYGGLRCPLSVDAVSARDLLRYLSSAIPFDYRAEFFDLSFQASIHMAKTIEIDEEGIELPGDIFIPGRPEEYADLEEIQDDPPESISLPLPPYTNDDIDQIQTTSDESFLSKIGSDLGDALASACFMEPELRGAVLASAIITTLVNFGLTPGPVLSGYRSRKWSGSPDMTELPLVGYKTPRTPLDIEDRIEDILDVVEKISASTALTAALSVDRTRIEARLGEGMIEIGIGASVIQAFEENHPGIIEVASDLWAACHENGFRSPSKLPETVLMQPDGCWWLLSNYKSEN